MNQKKLTVKLLREWLSRFPDEAHVYARTDDFGQYIITSPENDADQEIGAPEFPSA
jgi:hypothetical protein